MHILTYTNTPFIFSNFESESSTNPYTHYTKIKWSNFDNIIAMGDEEWEEKYLKDFTRLVEKSKKTWKPVKKELEVINIGIEQDKKELKIETLVTAEEKDGLVSLLQEYMDFFAWTYVDMFGLDINIVVHWIPLMERSKPVKQKARQIRSDMLFKVKDGNQKQWVVGFFNVVHYPQWVANIVVVLKKDNMIRICVDYRDLNKASQMMTFVLPHIDVLVDNAVKSATYSFMDGFLRYNHIIMVEEDRENYLYHALGNLML